MRINVSITTPVLLLLLQSFRVCGHGLRSGQGNLHSGDSPVLCRVFMLLHMQGASCFSEFFYILLYILPGHTEPFSFGKDTPVGTCVQ